MFSRRRPLDRRRKYSKEFFLTLLQQLKDAGFTNISVILPHNYETVDPKNSVVSVEDFIGRGRNFAAIIVVAKAPQPNEVLKILFVNSSAKALFVDDTFPSAASEPPALYFQSPDPARTYALFEYFYDILNQGSLAAFMVSSIVQLLAQILLLSELFYFGGKKKLLLSGLFGLTIYLDVGIVILCLWFTYKFFSYPSGLWIKPRRETRLLSMLKMAIRGEFRDNPIVQLAIVIIGGLIVLALGKLFF